MNGCLAGVLSSSMAMTCPAVAARSADLTKFARHDYRDILILRVVIGDVSVACAVVLPLAKNALPICWP